MSKYWVLAIYRSLDRLYIYKIVILDTVIYVYEYEFVSLIIHL